MTNKGDHMDDTMTRRGLLKAAAGLALSGPALAQRASPVPVEEDPNCFVFPRLRYRTLTNVNDQWQAHPDADEKLLQEIMKRTNIKVSKKPWQERIIGIDELGRAYRDAQAYAHIYSLPFLFMTGEGDFRITDEEAATFGEYFRRGGFLYADDCVYAQRSGVVGSGGDFFYQALVREFRKVLPGTVMRPVPHGHEIYHCFYDFPNGAPVCQGRPNPDMGLMHEGRLVAFLTSGDLHCGWTSRWFSNSVHQASYEMGVNIVVYALTH